MNNGFWDPCSSVTLEPI